MHTVKIPPAEGELLVIWHRVSRVHFVCEGRRRFIVLTYDDGSTKNLAPHQARDLWYAVEVHKGCPSPCFYRHEVDTAPSPCMDCQLAQMLEGIDVEVRPDPLPPRRKVTSWRRVVIALQWAVILFLIMGLAFSHSPISGTLRSKSTFAPAKGVERGGVGD